MRAQRPGESALLLLDAIDSLSRANVSYAVVGAMAASVHGVVRASMDADAILAVHSDEIAALERRLREDGFNTELRYGEAQDPIGAVLAITDGHGNRVDFIVGLRGLDKGAFSRCVQVPFHGETLRVAGLEDFVAMKLFAHGPQDLADARAALEAAGGSIDLPLLRKLAARFGSETSDALERLLRARGDASV
jgi:hypothetical protein